MGWFLTNATKSVQAQYFRPRLGMGWFGSYLNTEIEVDLFSSPSGDGLVRLNY